MVMYYDTRVSGMSTVPTLETHVLIEGWVFAGCVGGEWVAVWAQECDGHLQRCPRE